MTPEERELKNKRISESIKATREKRKTQRAMVFIMKINKGKLTHQQRKLLNRVFLEAKWLRNDIIGSDDVFKYNPAIRKVKVIIPEPAKQRNPKLHDRTEHLIALGSQVKQGVLKQVKDDIRGLHAVRVKGGKVGSLKFTSEVNSINLPQYGVTWRVKGNSNRIKIQGIPGYLYVKNLQHELFNTQYDYNLANARLLRRSDGYYIAITAYLSNEDYKDRKDKHDAKVMRKEPASDTYIGVDAGLQHQFIMSTNGEPVYKDAYRGESKRSKRARAHQRMKKHGSKRYDKCKRVIRQDGERRQAWKRITAHQFVLWLLSMFETICIQDEHFQSWFRVNGCKMSDGILGRVYAELRGLAGESSPRVLMCDEWQPTTQYCAFCGHCTKHKLSERVFHCAYCGFEMDRDTHAALNMIILALEPLPAYWWRLSEFKPLDSVKRMNSGLTVRESAVINHAGLHSIAGNVSRLVTPVGTLVSDGDYCPIAFPGQ